MQIDIRWKELLVLAVIISVALFWLIPIIGRGSIDHLKRIFCRSKVRDRNRHSCVSETRIDDNQTD